MTNFLLTAAAILIALGYAFYTDKLEIPQGYKSNKPSPEAIAKIKMQENDYGLKDLADKIQKVPSFSFEDLNGTKHSIEDFRGKTVIINFWATWCPPCITEFPDLIEIAATREDIVLIAISNDMREEKIAPFLAKMDKAHMSSADVIVAYDADKSITQDLFQTYRLPESIIVTPDGYMKQKVVGIIDWKKDIDL